jgi:hypothetical protein
MRSTTAGWNGPIRPVARHYDVKLNSFPGAKQKKPLRDRIPKQFLVVDTGRGRQRRYRGIVHQLCGFIAAY